MNLRRIKEGLITLGLLIGVVRLLWQVLSPMIPYLVVALLLVFVYQFVFGRRRL